MVMTLRNSMESMLLAERELLYPQISACQRAGWSVPAIMQSMERSFVKLVLWAPCTLLQQECWRLLSHHARFLAEASLRIGGQTNSSDIASNHSPYRREQPLPWNDRKTICVIALYVSDGQA